MPPIAARTVGGPGGGKTRRLLEILDLVLQKVVRDPMKVGFVSFTRSARRVASTRAAEKFGLSWADLEKEGYFKTLHAIAFKSLGVQQGELLTGTKDDSHWLKEATGDENAAFSSAREDDDYLASTSGGFSDATKALNLWGCARNRLVPLEAVWGPAERAGCRIPSLDECQWTVSRYEAAKKRDDLLDFTDLLMRFAGRRWTGSHDAPFEKAPPDGLFPLIQVWFHDEAQDQSLLTSLAFKRLIQHSQYVYLGGDPWQCQPEGTAIQAMVSRGNRWHKTKPATLPIEQLKAGDLIAGYSPKDKGLCYNRIVQAIQSRDYEGDLVEVTTATGGVSRYTPEHRCYASFSPLRNKFAVYLMRRGLQFRIGTCRLTYRTGGNGIVCRLRQEGGCAAWLLELHDSIDEARCREAELSYQYNIPEALFSAPGGSEEMQPSLDRFWSFVGTNSAPALRLLRSKGLSPKHPIATPEGSFQQSYKRPVLFAACNLISGMLVSEVGRWVPVTVRRVVYKGPVYSLSVSHNQLYVADGIITHNSIYGFCGADARHFTGWPVAREEILPLSHRCRANVLALANGIMHRHEKARPFTAAHEDGEVVHTSVEEALSGIKPGEDTLVLARTNDYAHEAAAYLDEALVPWKPIKGGGGYAAPARAGGVIALCDLRAGKHIDGEAWWRLTDLLPSRAAGVELLRRGTKKHFADPEGRKHVAVTLGMLDLIGATEALKVMIASGAVKDVLEAPAARMFASACLHGAVAVGKPSCTIGTIHSAKGQEADNVVLLNRLPYPTLRAMEEEEGLREERRVWFVGCSRARHRVTIADCGGEPFPEI